MPTPKEIIVVPFVLVGGLALVVLLQAVLAAFCFAFWYTLAWIVCAVFGFEAAYLVAGATLSAPTTFALFMTVVAMIANMLRSKKD